MTRSIDLSKLSKQEKIQLLEALDEKKRRARLRKPAYVPNDAQRAVICSKALERYLFCGNGFGKSTILVNEVHWAATGFNPILNETTPVPAKIALVLDSPEKIDDFLLEYRKWNSISDEQLHKKGRANYSFITYDNGSTVTVITHEVNELKLEGSQWTHVFFDEPPPKRVYTGIVRGGRIKGRPLKLLLAGTPLSAPWLRTDIYEPWTEGRLENVECFKGRTEDNADNLEMDSVRRLWSKLSAHELAVRSNGDFHDLEGLALSHLFRRQTHTIPRAKLDWEEKNPCVIVMDPHPSKAHVAILMGADRDGRLYVLEEYKEKAFARKFIKSLIGLGWFSKYRILDIVYDSLGNSEMTSGEGFKPFGTVVNEVLQQHGLGRARATSYQEKSDEEFIERIRDGLAIPDQPDNFGQLVPKLRVLADCTNTIGDIENVQWKRDKNLDENKPSLEISNRDFLACVKYGLACNLKFNKQKDRVYYVNKNPYGINLNDRRKEQFQMRARRQKPKKLADEW